MPAATIRGILKYFDNETRLQQCACEPGQLSPLNVLLARAQGYPDDITGASNYLKNLGWQYGTCVEVQGVASSIGRVSVFYLQQIHACPNGPCYAN